MKRAWLADVSWNAVVETNRLLCANKDAFHGPTSDGYAEAQNLWNANHSKAISLIDAIELCRKCHKIAPFSNYNGNTFTAIIRVKLGKLGLPPDTTASLRSLAGHVIAGSATPEERELLLKAINEIDL